MTKQQTYDPNSHLAPEIIKRGLSEARQALAVTGLPWQPATHPSSRSLLWLYQGWDWHLIYVRITTDDATFTGVGEKPRVLAELSREMHSRLDAVVRVHLGADGEVQHIGFPNLMPKLLYMARDWNRRMLDGKTALEHLKLAGDKPAILTVRPVYNPDWHKPKTDEELITSFRAEYRQPPTEMPDVREGESEDAFVNRRLAGFRAYPERPAHGHFVLKLAADGLPESDLSVNIAALAASTTWNDSYDILTCSCGSSGCAGTGGIPVTHESGLTVWWLSIEGTRRFLVFDRQQYRTEVFTKIREALRFHATLPPEVRFGDIMFNEGPAAQREWVQAALVEAENFERW